MDEMDYDMHIPPGTQPPSSMAEARPIPRCPYLLPNPSQTTTSGNLYDPLQFSSGRQPWTGFRQPLQNPHTSPSRYSSSPFYMMSQTQEQSDRQRPNDEYYHRPQARATFTLQPPSLPAARPSVSESSPPLRPNGLAEGAAVPAQTPAQVAATDSFRSNPISEWERRISFTEQQQQQQQQEQQQQQQQQIHQMQQYRQQGSTHPSGVWAVGSGSTNDTYASNTTDARTEEAEQLVREREQEQQLLEHMIREQQLREQLNHQQLLLQQQQQQRQQLLQQQQRRAELQEYREELRRREQESRSDHQPQSAASAHSQAESVRLPRVSSILDSAQLREREAPSPAQTGFQSSPSPSHRSSSPASAVSDSVSMRGSQDSGRSTRSSARPTTNSQFSPAATAPVEYPPVLSHTTLDRTFWDSPSQHTGRGNSRNSSTGRLETAQHASPPGSTAAGSALASASASAAAQAQAQAQERRIRASLRHRRTGHGSNGGGNPRTSDLESDDDMDAFSEEQQALHHFIDHLEGSVPANASQSALFGGGGIRARQVLRGAMANKRIASKSAIASLVCVGIDTLSPTERTCIICYNDFGVPSPEGINEAPLQLPRCKHIFGDHCIKKWFEESDSCPYCRDKVPSDPMIQLNQSAFQQFLRAQSMQASRRGAAPAVTPQSIIANNHGYARMLNSGDRNATMQDLTSQTLGGGGQGQGQGQGPMRAFALGDRRAPPEEFNEGQRRTRARHGTSRSSATRSLSSTTDSFQQTPPAGPSSSHSTARTAAAAQHQATPPTMLRPPPQPPAQQPSQSMQIPHPLPAPTQQGRDRCVPPYSAHPNYMWQAQVFSQFGPPPSGAFQMPPVPSMSSMPPFMHSYAPGNGSGPMQGAGNRMSYPSYPASMYGTGSNSDVNAAPYAQPQPPSTLPPPPAMPTTEASHNTQPESVSLSLPLHPPLPPIYRLDMPDRLPGAAPLSNLQEGGLPTTSAGWGPS